MGHRKKFAPLVDGNEQGRVRGVMDRVLRTHADEVVDIKRAVNAHQVANEASGGGGGRSAGKGGGKGMRPVGGKKAGKGGKKGKR